MKRIFSFGGGLQTTAMGSRRHIGTWRILSSSYYPRSPLPITTLSHIALVICMRIIGITGLSRQSFREDVLTISSYGQLSDITKAKRSKC